MSYSRSGRSSVARSEVLSEGSERDDPDPIDFTKDSTAYFATLQRQNENAQKIRKDEKDQEKTLMEYLPVNEKFSLNKEGKVLTRWQERQRDWDRIQAQLTRRLASKVKRPLMMATTDEFRARMEEYDLIQAAMPVKDRYSEDSWQVLLRGGGPIRVAVGHIFSGIECVYDMQAPHPKMVRKPKPPQQVFINDTFLEQTERYLEKKTKYEKSMREIRPHTMSYQDAGQVVIRTTGLFNWAKESSELFFKEQEELGRLSAIEEEASAHHILSDIQQASKDSLLQDADQVPKIELITARELVFETLPGEKTMQKVRFKNTGLTALTYTWRRVIEGSEHAAEEQPTSRTGDEFRDILKDKGVDRGALRSHQLSHARDSFMCLRDSGFVLPEETIATTFVFCPRAGEGSYCGSWILEFVPEDTAIFQSQSLKAGPSAPENNNNNGNNNNNSNNNNQGSSDVVQISVCSVGLNLHGHCTVPDESVQKRDFVKLCFDRGMITAMCRDVVYSCVRRVRDPVRPVDLNARHVTVFSRVNVAHLEALSARYGNMLPVFVTAERLLVLCAVYQAAVESLAGIRSRLLELRRQDAEINGSSFDASEQHDINTPDALELNPSHRAALQSELFPEEVLEIFDEVSNDDITPQWNYDITSIISSLETGRARAEEIEKLEETINQYTAAQEKLRLKEERRAARRAAGDSDDEESDDDDDEEDDDDEDKPAKPIHPLVQQMQSYQQQVHSALNALVARPEPTPVVMDIARDCLWDVIDKMFDCHQAALEEAEIADVINENGGTIPTLPSPFTSSEGAAVWKHALAQTSSQPDDGGKGGKGKGKGKPAKPAKGAAPRTELTEQEVHYYYKVMFDNVRTSMLDAGVAMFDRVEAHIHETAPQTLCDYGMTADSLLQVAAIRAEDVACTDTSAGAAAAMEGTEAEAVEAQEAATTEGKIVCMNFNGSAFTGAADAIHSAFDVKQQNKAHAVSPIVEMVKLGAKAVILFYETPSALSGSKSSCNEDTNGVDPATDLLAPHCAEIETMVNQQWQAYQEEHTKSLRKQKLLKRRDPPPRYRSIRFARHCASMGELYHRADSLVAEFTTASQQADGTMTVLVVENIAAAGVVPVEPEYEEVESDDDAAPVEIGLEESKSLRLQRWMNMRPHRVEVSAVAVTGGGGGDMVKCYTDRAAAVAEAYSLLQNAAAANTQQRSSSSSSSLVWLEASMVKLFDPTSAFNRAHKMPTSVKTTRLTPMQKRFVSGDIREACIWTGVLQLLPQATGIFQALKQASSDEAIPDAATAAVEADDNTAHEVDPTVAEGTAGGNELTESVGTKAVNVSHAHFAQVFPFSNYHGSAPTSAVVVGGLIKAEKFRVLNELIDLVDSIYVVGEIALAFLSLSIRFTYTHYSAQCAQYRSVCLKLIGRARMRGCRLIFPEDVLCGDEEITADMVAKAATRIDLDSRSEGFEYEGEVKPILVADTDDSLSYATAAAADGGAAATETEEAGQVVEDAAVTPTVVDGYVYDIGPKTCDMLRNALSSVDFVLVWGPAGLCEASSFQNGQQCLVDCTSTKPSGDNSAAAHAATPPPESLERNPQRSVLIGDATVEWFSRMLDSDGELAGNIVGAGMVSYCSRDSTAMTGLVGMFPSSIVQEMLHMRPAVENEWVYSKRVYEEEEDEEEDDSEEEEDD